MVFIIIVLFCENPILSYHHYLWKLPLIDLEILTYPCRVLSLLSYNLEINHGSQNVLGDLTWVGGYWYFIPSQKRGIQFTNIRQFMLKLKTHSGFQDLFRFWYVYEYKYGSMLWLDDGNVYLRLRKMLHTIYAANGKVSHIHRRMC